MFAKMNANPMERVDHDNATGFLFCRRSNVPHQPRRSLILRADGCIRWLGNFPHNPGRHAPLILHHRRLQGIQQLAA
jgi:hypothetical protein